MTVQCQLLPYAVETLADKNGSKRPLVYMRSSSPLVDIRHVGFVKKIFTGLIITVKFINLLQADLQLTG